MINQKAKLVLPNLKNLQSLVGTQDALLNLIIDAFHISVKLDALTLIITGSNIKNVVTAKKVLSVLSKLVQSDNTLQGGDVLSAIKMAKQGKLKDFLSLYNVVLLRDNDNKKVTVRTYGQKKFVNKIAHNTITFGIGPAGSGKTFLSVALAIRALKHGDVSKIVVSRPAVEAGENLGFLPGDLKAKIDPYLRPIYDAFNDLIGKNMLRQYLNNGQIEIAPLAYMRGRTLKNAFVILDEAQNTTNEQMKMFLTRLGFGSKMVVEGDISQVDLPCNKRSGLRDARHILKGIKDITFEYFSANDIVRQPVVGRIVKAYDKSHKNNPFHNF